VLATKAEEALITARLPVFQRGGKLVRPAADLAWTIVDGMAGGAR